MRLPVSQFTIWDKTFGTGILFFVNHDSDELEKKLALYDRTLEGLGNGAGGAFWDLCNGTVLVWLANVECNDDASMPWKVWEVVFHECGHAANCFENHLGIQDRADEFRLYMQGFYSRQTLLKLQAIAEKHGTDKEIPKGGTRRTKPSRKSAS